MDKLKNEDYDSFNKAEAKFVGVVTNFIALVNQCVYLNVETAINNHDKKLLNKYTKDGRLDYVRTHPTLSTDNDLLFNQIIDLLRNHIDWFVSDFPKLFNKYSKKDQKGFKLGLKSNLSTIEKSLNDMKTVADFVDYINNKINNYEQQNVKVKDIDNRCSKAEPMTTMITLKMKHPLHLSSLIPGFNKNETPDKAVSELKVTYAPLIDDNGLHDVLSMYYPG